MRTRWTKSKARRLALMLKLNRPEYFGYNIYKLTEERDYHAECKTRIHYVGNREQQEQREKEEQEENRYRERQRQKQAIEAGKRVLKKGKSVLKPGKASKVSKTRS